MTLHLMENITRTELITEIKAELSARRRIWDNYAHAPEQFKSGEYQKRYDDMKFSLWVFERMTDAEFYQFRTRVIHHRQQLLAQQSLF